MPLPICFPPLVWLIDRFSQLLLRLALWLQARHRSTSNNGYRYRRKKLPAAQAAPKSHSRRKPDWVRTELIRDAARCPAISCRTLAHTFNRRHAGSDGTTVGKTYVSTLLLDYRHDILLERRVLDQRRPGIGEKNRIWALDGTGKTDADGTTHFILGLIDHGTRRCLALQALTDKRSVTILRIVLDAVIRYGRPKIIRTDNEAIFTSRLFRCGLKTLGIRHQTTELHSPWQNGRIERLFGSLKSKLRRWTVHGHQDLNLSLAQFYTWYNHIRPHQHLQGRTPAEVWAGVDIYRRQVNWRAPYGAWGGLLNGELLIH